MLDRSRSIVLACVVPVLLAASGLAEPGLTFVQTIKDGDGGVDIKNHVGSMTARGNYVYVSIVYAGAIKIFRRDLATGQLTYAENFVWAGDHDVVGTMVWAQGRLYFYGGAGHWTGDVDSRGLHCLDADAATGKLTEKAKLDIPIASGLVVSPDQKNLYLLLRQKRMVVRYRLDTDGIPEQAEETVFKDAANDVNNLTLSGDGRVLYGVSNEGEGGRISYLNCIVVNAEGTMVYKGKYSLAKLTEGIEWPQGKWGYGWGRGFGMSPDGLHCYADFCNYGGADARLAVFKRNAANSEVAFLGRCEDSTTPTMCRIVAYLFEPDGLTGYFASGTECAGNVVGWFTRDPASGKLTLGGVIKETKGSGPCALWLDAENGFLYSGGWARPQLNVMKTGRKAPSPSVPAATSKRPLP